MAKEIVYLTGLPRSGSTLVCNLLAVHSGVTVTPSSPLCNIIQNMRRHWSDDPFLLAQLEANYDDVYNRLGRSVVSFMQAWSSDDEAPVVVDKNRGWLACVEFLRVIQPNFKMIVCLRNIEGIYGSIEKQHRNTILLDFPDHMEHNLVDVRAKQLFGDGGIIGHPLKCIYNIGDVPDIASHLYFLRYEDLLEKRQKVIDSLFKWLGLDPVDIDFENIEQVTSETDSFYRYKYPHSISSKLAPPEEQPISSRIIKTMRERFEWFYNLYYPEKVQVIRQERVKIGKTRAEDRITKEINEEINGLDEDTITQLEQAIEDEIKFPTDPRLGI
jgi:sulfotransferase